MSEYEQASLFDILKEKGALEELSVDELSKLSSQLTTASGIVNRRKRELEAQRRRESVRETQRARQVEARKAEEERRRLERVKREREQARIKHVTSMELDLSWENAFAGDKRAEGVRAANPADGLVLSLANLGKVDIEYISEITGISPKEAIVALKGSIFQNPDTWEECFYKGWETPDEYLSGNLRRKLDAARAADIRYQGYFAQNVSAIESLLPSPIPAEDIYVTIGSPWVPSDVINAFICYLFGRPWCKCEVRHVPIIGSWEIRNKSALKRTVESEQTFGTKRISALDILERTLNMRPICVTDEVSDPTSRSGKKRVVNRAETLLALEKQALIIHTFRDWVWTNDERKRRLTEIYDSRYGCIRRRIFDGSFLRFPGMAEDMALYPYQKDAVARIVFTPNTLLAHEVGSGKTYVMVAAAMEMKRMGLSTKNLFVVPNNIIGQWREVFLALYPDARIRCVEPKDFVPKKRERTLANIRDDDYDGIVMAYSCFERIPLSLEDGIRALSERREEICTAIRGQKSPKGVSVSSALERKRGQIDRQIDDLREQKPPTGITFDSLGVTRLFIDEAHNFKNVPFETKVGSVLGVNAKGSKRCKDIMAKVRSVQRANNGGGVVLATGTPITNSVTDAYIMQSYLQSGELSIMGLSSFDSWIGMFAQKSTGFEIDVDTSTYRLATRFSRFHNLAELSAMLASVADFHQVDASAGIPEFDGYDDVMIPKSNELSEYLMQISERADNVRKRRVSRASDNMLKITTDGRKAALDLRLVDVTRSRAKRSKVVDCATNIVRIYRAGNAGKLAQLVFCDTSTPKSGFNLYDDLKELLVNAGIPPDEIAFVHDAKTEKAREELYAAMRAGRVRVLVGSTLKLGLGVNVQERLVALHHLDVPWRPADMAQREGRILRRGNTCGKVQVFRYITEGSFDAYSWQLLETKQRFISELLAGSLDARTGKDVEGTVLDYAEVKALAVGNPLMKERVETANEIARLLTLSRKDKENRARMQADLDDLPARRERLRERLDACRDDLAFYTVHRRRLTKEERRAYRGILDRSIREGALLAHERLAFEYRGFNVVVPANMTWDKPSVWLERAGRYRVELGEFDVGNLIRIDNRLDSLADVTADIERDLEELEAREASLRRELAEDKDYDERALRLREALKDLDEKLGVSEYERGR